MTNYEYFKKYMNDLLEGDLLESGCSEETVNEYKKALEYLLKENEELKEITKTYNTFCIPHKEDKIIFADKNYFDRGIFSCNLITTTKVKEKIKEIENYTYTSKEERQCQNYAIDRLKELMEVDNE